LLHPENMCGHSAEGAEDCSREGLTRYGVGFTGFLHRANVAAPTSETRLRDRPNYLWLLRVRARIRLRSRNALCGRLERPLNCDRLLGDDLLRSRHDS
jgi:hypothetical protein